MSELEQVKEFHDEFGFSVLAGIKPSFLDADLAEVRANFLQEELDEYCEACGLRINKITGKWVYFLEPEPEDLEKALDGLIDLAYVLYGTVDFHGMSGIWSEAFTRVHDANMAKIRVNSAEESKRGTTIDVRKPEGWVAPTFGDLLFY